LLLLLRLHLQRLRLFPVTRLEQTSDMQTIFKNKQQMNKGHRMHKIKQPPLDSNTEKNEYAEHEYSNLLSPQELKALQENSERWVDLQQTILLHRATFKGNTTEV
jgi:hypothetical protein